MVLVNGLLAGLDKGQVPRDVEPSLRLLMGEIHQARRSPDDLKKAVTDAGRAATQAQREEVAAAAAEVIAKLEKSGMKINKVPDFKPFRASVQGVYEQFKGSIGPDLMQEALAAVQ